MSSKPTFAIPDSYLPSLTILKGENALPAANIVASNDRTFTFITTADIITTSAKSSEIPAGALSILGNGAKFVGVLVGQVSKFHISSATTPSGQSQTTIQATDGTGVVITTLPVQWGEIAPGRGIRPDWIIWPTP